MSVWEKTESKTSQSTRAEEEPWTADCVTQISDRLTLKTEYLRLGAGSKVFSGELDGKTVAVKELRMQNYHDPQYHDLLQLKHAEDEVAALARVEGFLEFVQAPIYFVMMERYIVMESAPSIVHELHRGKYECEEGVELLRRDCLLCASALASAHRRRLVVRDVSPGNFGIRPASSDLHPKNPVCLLDPREVCQLQHVKTIPHVVGTPGFAPSNVCNGHEADAMALGAVIEFLWHEARLGNQMPHDVRKLVAECGKGSSISGRLRAIEEKTGEAILPVESSPAGRDFLLWRCCGGEH